MSRKTTGNALVAKLRADWARITEERIRAAVARERKRCADAARSYSNTDPSVAIDLIVAEIEKGRRA